LARDSSPPESRATSLGHEAGKTFAFIAVILDCINEESKLFYQKWDFQALPGSPYRLYLSAKHLEAMMQGRG